MSPAALTAEDLRAAAKASARGPVWVAWEVTPKTLEVPEGHGLRLRLLRKAADAWAGPRRSVGLVDARRSAFALDMGYYATLHIDGQEWRGASGALVGKRYEQNPPDPAPLDLLLAGGEATEMRADPTPGAYTFEVDREGNFGAEFDESRLVRLTRRVDGRLDQLSFEDVCMLPDFPNSHLPSWASDL